MPASDHNDQNLHYSIRSFRPEDQHGCEALYREGLIAPKIADNDTGLDLDDIAKVYLRPGSHFWVAVDDEGELIGMIGVQHHDEGTGEIRRLRVSTRTRRQGVGQALVETAIRFCQSNSYLKITLDTYMEREPAVKLFEHFHFRLQRSKIVEGRELLYFYLDLYTGDRPAVPKPS